MKRLYFLIISILLMAGAALSEPFINLDDPILKLAANSGVDVVWDGTYLWIGTSKGISGTDDNGASWITYDSTNGLPSNEISALAVAGGDLWIATSGSIISQGQSIPVGEGISLTSNFGSTIQTFTPFQASSPGMLCYDLDANDTLVYAACFYGGLIYSKDRGQTWENLFPDTLAENDFYDSLFQYYNNRFFSVKVDDNYEDTLVVWGGTAAGVNQFQFIAREAKLAGNLINDFALQDGYTWVATDSGLSRSENNGVSYRSYFQSDGLTNNYTSAVAAAGDFVICAGYDDELDEGTGFAFSTDFGTTWEQSLPTQAVGADKRVGDIAITVYGDSDLVIWAACTAGGLIRSMDSAQTWEQVVLDADELSPDSAFNQIFSLKASYPFPDVSPCTDADTLLMLVGSGGGLWTFKIPCPYSGAIESPELHRLDDIQLAGRKVAAVDANYWVTEEEDTVYEWALATHPFEGQGAIAVLLSQDYGNTWKTTLASEKANDLIYTDSTIWAATDEGLRRYNRSANSWIPVELGDIDVEDLALDTVLTSLLFNSADVYFWVGSANGLATSRNGLPNSWSIDTVNLNPDVFDYNIRATSGDENGLSGNFAVAIETQYYNGDRFVWVAGNSTGLTGEQNGINLSRDNGHAWEIVLTGINAWNFAFDGPDAYAATSAGLLKTSDFGETWDTLDVVDMATGTRINPGTEFFGVGDANGEIWAASDDGMARTDDGGNTWAVYRTFQSVGEGTGAMTYASPVPSSPYSTAGGVVRFHYRFERSGNVTVKVYDFAMNLVATPVDGAERVGGQQYDNDEWNMRNDNGTVVATGPYYFKVENSSGEEVWGKIMVIP